MSEMQIKLGVLVIMLCVVGAAGSLGHALGKNHSTKTCSVKPITVVDEWAYMPTVQELAAAYGIHLESAETYGEASPNYVPPPKNEKGETAIRSHLQCPEGFDLEFPGDKWENAICVRRGKP